MKLTVLVSLAGTLSMIGTSVVAQAQDRSYTAGSGGIGPIGMVTDPARSAAAAARLKQYKNLKAEAIDHLRKGEKEKAIELLEKMLTVEDYFSVDRIELADLYTSLNKPKDVIRMLRPLVYHGPYSAGGYGAEPAVRMLYVLALLDTRKWEEAVAVYESTINSNLHWQLVGGGAEHAIPNIHFNVSTADYEAMRAQAHLILGARLPISSGYASGAEDVSKQDREYMLDHLKQSIKYNAQSPDAHFVSGLILKKMGRYDEARKELASAARYALDEAQPEIKAALQDLKATEENQRKYAAGRSAQAPAKQAGPKQP